MERLLVLFTAFVLTAACSELIAQVTIRSQDIASQVDVLITSYQWDANTNVSGSMMPDTTGLGAILAGGEADFTSIVAGLNKNATMVLQELPADVPAVDSFATATHVETVDIVVDEGGNDSTFYQFMKLDENSYTALGGVIMFDITQNSQPDTLVARYQPDGWEIRELPAETGDSWNTAFTQETWVTFPGVGTILTEGTREQREYEIEGVATLTTPAGSAPAIVVHVYEFITQELGMVDIALERYSWIARSGLAVTVTWNINKETRERISLNDVAYFVPEGLSGVAGEQENDRLEFAGSWPNPFTSTTTIPFNLKRSGHVHVAIYDMTGREVATLLNKRLAQGSHSVKLDAGELPQGMYNCIIESEGITVTDRIVLRR